ncbi:MAG: hypothetical protein ABI905_00340 [Betaproteobacteria bacterium]
MRTTLPVANNSSRAGEIVPTLPPFSLQPLEVAFKETGERPLFTPTRRPQALAAATVPTMKKGQFKLSGTSVSGELTVAFLVELSSGKTVRVTKGKEINGITLDTVEGNRVVLKQGDETEELVLRTAASPPVRTPPPAPPGPVPAFSPVPGQPGMQRPPPVASVVPVPPGVMPPAPTVPNPGSSQLPGFVMPSAAAGQAPGAAPTVDPANAAQQRRRRIQAQPQQ